MQITYRELEDFLGEIHMVALDKRTALKGRLKHFQRLGWPAGTNKGKGARVNYGIGQTMSLAMGMEMLQLGLTPERVVEQLGRGGGSLAEGFSDALKEYGYDPDPIYYIFDPESLNSLREQEEGKFRTGLQSLMVSASKMETAMTMASKHWTRRFAIINISAILDDYISYFIDKGLAAPENLAQPLENWRALEDNKSKARLDELISKAKTNGDT